MRHVFMTFVAISDISRPKLLLVFISLPFFLNCIFLYLTMAFRRKHCSYLTICNVLHLKKRFYIIFLICYGRAHLLHAWVCARGCMFMHTHEDLIMMYSSNQQQAGSWPLRFCVWGESVWCALFVCLWESVVHILLTANFMNKIDAQYSFSLVCFTSKISI